jgi:hypothetical protein
MELCNDSLVEIIYQNQILLWSARSVVFLLILYSIIGYIKVLEISLVAVEKITHKKWNKTFANFTIVALSLNFFEIFYPTIELFYNRFESLNESGPNLIIVNFYHSFINHY